MRRENLFGKMLPGICCEKMDIKNKNGGKSLDYYKFLMQDCTFCVAYSPPHHAATGSGGVDETSFCLVESSQTVREYFNS